MNAIATTLPPRNLWRSTGAILPGLLVVVVLSEGTDLVMRTIRAFPPVSSRMDEPGLLGLALAYRCLYNVLAAILTARLAPRNTTRHLIVFAAIGVVLGSAGVVANAVYHMGPAWYPVLLAISALPCTWIGTKLDGMRATNPASTGR